MAVQLRDIAIPLVAPADLFRFNPFVAEYWGSLARHCSALPYFTAGDLLAKPNAIAHFIVSGGEPVGFIYVLQKVPAQGIIGTYLSDFFLRSGNERALLPAVRLLTETYPGEWTADVFTENKDGMRFTHSMTRRFASDVKERLIETERGMVNRFWFRTGV